MQAYCASQIPCCCSRSFLKKGFVEVHTQNALSILAACEDPETVSKYDYQGNVWPLPQTGQMWLEDVLLNDPDNKGLLHCIYQLSQ